jgi:hypothetical protein
MREFKVISLAVSGKNNKIYRTHDVVNERQVVDADELVARKHLKEITEESVTTQEPPPPPPPPADDQSSSGEAAGSGQPELEVGAGKPDETVSRETDSTGSESTGDNSGGQSNPESESNGSQGSGTVETSNDSNSKGTATIDSIDIAELRRILTERGVTFKPNASKKELWAKYIGL